uniref:Endo/exonuclease/phosphatase domain-containing protein n=1 Tax=Strongyloides papillosus TaxID=174720 RepID=A0A0N5CIY2_STREA
MVCYMQTSSSQDSKVEEVYDQMKEIMSGFKKLYPLSRNNIIIGGDFNAKIKCTIRRGKFSNSAHLENNERGTKLELWTESENLSITNRLVIKKTGELDYFLIHSAKRASFIDTRKIKRFNIRSDHKPLLLKVKFGKQDTKQYSTRKKPRIFSLDELNQDIINKTNNKALI